MRLLRMEKGRRVFQMRAKEMALLLGLLDRYPALPSACQPPGEAARGRNRIDQALLEEALAEQRRENRQALEAFRTNGRNLRRGAHGWELAVSDTEIEWLLQVLNDIRVGSWMKLGCRDRDPGVAELNAATAPHAWAMALTSYLQTVLLEALRQEPPP